MTAETPIALYRSMVKKFLREQKNAEIPNGNHDHAAVLFEQFFENATQKVRIFCKNLSSDVFEQEHVLSAAEGALSRGVSIQILTQESVGDSKFTKLSVNEGVGGKFSIGVAKDPYKTIRTNFATMDGTAYRFEPNRDEPKAVANMYDPDTTSLISKTFDNILAP